MPSTRQVGKQYEDMAAEYLKQQGYDILERNFQCRQGEIDIVAKDKNYLCFIEVKYRKNARRGYGYEAVTGYKQRKISRAALYYMAKRRQFDVPVRFDVVSIDAGHIRLIKHAFEYGR